MKPIPHPNGSEPSPSPLRRSLLAGSAALMAMPVFVRDVRAQGRLAVTPSQTEGPFYPVTIPQDSDFDLLRHGERRYGKGQAAWVGGRVLNPDGQPLKGGVIEIWQCDVDGHYDHPRDRGSIDPDFQGFGRVTLAADGSFRFRTIRPAAYPGRTPHIHAKIKLGRNELLTTQLYVEGEAANARDGLWRRLPAGGREALTRPWVAGPDGLQAEYTLVVDA